jgi:hypothetical protein
MFSERPETSFPQAERSTTETAKKKQDMITIAGYQLLDAAQPNTVHGCHRDSGAHEPCSRAPPRASPSDYAAIAHHEATGPPRKRRTGIHR